MIPRLRRTLISAVGGGLGIAGMVGLAQVAHLPLAAVPFTTSIVLTLAEPESPMAQPRNVVGGHMLCALCGLVVLHVFGSDPWLAPVAVGLGICAMQLTRTMHPPAGIHGLLVFVIPASWSYLLMPVAVGTAILVAFAFIYHRLTVPNTWPKSSQINHRDRRLHGWHGCRSKMD